MRKVKRWRYYCEHCKKSGASGGHIAAHEKSCTSNPERERRMCKIAELDQRSTDDLLAMLDERGADGLLAEVHCPACVVAAIRAFRKREGPMNREDSPYIVFDYKPAAAAFWEEVNRKDSY